MDDSFALEHFVLLKQRWEVTTPFYFVIEHQGEGLFSNERQAQLDAVYEDIQALEFMLPPYTNWLSDFEEYLNISSPFGGLATERMRLQGDAVEFGKRAIEFLDAPSFSRQDGSLCAPWRHKRNVVFDGGVVIYSRLSAMYSIDPASQATSISGFHETMEVLFPAGYNGELENPRAPNTYGISLWFASAERDEEMKSLIFKTLAIACAAVTATVMVLFSPLVGLFVGAVVVCVDVIILGLLTLWGSKLDLVALVCLSTSVGLVVDYSTHTASTYVNHPGGPAEKLHASVSTMGASVLSGGGSTFLGISVLGFASSKAFRTFFLVLGTAVLMGTLIGVTVSPILLSIFHAIGSSFRGRGKCESDAAGVLAGPSGPPPVEPIGQ